MCRLVTSFAVLFAALVVANSSAVAQEPATPGKEHKELKKLEGTWDAVVKSTDGSETKAVATYKSICGGLWLESDFSGDLGGLKFSGKVLDGYDPVKKQYVAVWVDSMTATPLMLTGTTDDSGKVLTMTGEGPGPDGVTKYKTVTKTESDDKHVFTMFFVMPEGDMELMTITYTRRKK
jgi:hypothetical protein